MIYKTKDLRVSVTMAEKDYYVGNTLIHPGDAVIKVVGHEESFLIKKDIFDVLFEKEYSSLEDFIVSNRDNPAYQMPLPEIPS